MKINPIYSYGKYKTSLVSRPKEMASLAGSSVTGGKTDTVLFSAEWKHQQGIGQIADSIVRQMNEPEQPERLEALKASIADRSYFVSAEELAEAIMSRAHL